MRIYGIFFVILLFSFFITTDLKADSEKIILGMEVFNNKAMCGTCHVLKAAGSTGDIGPDLDSLKPSEEQVKGVVTEGLGVMPAFGEEGLITFCNENLWFFFCCFIVFIFLDDRSKSRFGKNGFRVGSFQQ